MGTGRDRLGAFDARIAALRRTEVTQLREHARELVALEARLQEDVDAFGAIARVAHRIRGLSAETELRKFAHRLEEAARRKQAPAVRAALPVVVRLVHEDAAKRRNKETGLGATPLPPPFAKGNVLGERLRASAPDGDVARRILVVDDDPAILRMTALTLERMGGFEVVTAEDYDEFRRSLAQETFDAVITDAMMPKSTGIDVCDAVRAEQTGAKIVILSASTPAELGWELTEEGPDEWWRKPLPPRALLEHVAALLARSDAPR